MAATTTNTHSAMLCLLHNRVNKCGECKLQLISNLFDVTRISLDSKTTFHTFWLHLATKHSTLTLLCKFTNYMTHTYGVRSSCNNFCIWIDWVSVPLQHIYETHQRMSVYRFKCHTKFKLLICDWDFNYLRENKLKKNDMLI